MRFSSFSRENKSEKPKAGKPSRVIGFGIFLIFILFFFDLSKIYADFFLQKYHPAASSTGGMKVPPDEPAAGAL